MARSAADKLVANAGAARNSRFDAGVQPLIGDIEEKRGEFVEAAKAYQAAMALAPDQEQYRIALALELVSHQTFAPAIAVLEQAAAALLQGMTAHYLVYDTYPLKRREIALVHAAAGGVGLLLVQMAKRIGARVIATVGTDEKAKLAREAGACDVIVYTRQDFEAETKRLTDGKGVHVIYDGVGKSTFDKDLNLLRPRGYLVLFGAASGPVPAFDPILLSQKGSIFLTRPSLGHHIATRKELEQRSREVFQQIAGKTATRLDDCKKAFRS